ncbi:MAG TPA: GDP-mannose 4,6-dehydratase [Gemmatimonadaceae bacterium]|nr:GDP-mannose 4,6-dehydratase [Gemmatimonadaceae bacterium]
MKKAFITGIAGQDGSYLAEYLLSLGYEVHGIVRRNSIPENQQTRIELIRNRAVVHYGDLSDVGGLERLLRLVQPDELYNLAAQSHVRISYDVPQFTAQTNALGALNVLEAYRNCCPEARYYQASSSEMFGDSVDPDGFQRETTPMHPVSPYGCAKLYAYHITRNYRKAYKLHASNGILFNHESPRRGTNFVTNKVVKTAVHIKRGKLRSLELGNMDSSRDWGHSKDYVRAMHMIVNHAGPDDYIVATGQTRSVREMTDYVFRSLGLDYREFVTQNPIYMRPEELPYLRGDCSKLKRTFDWRPEYDFESLMDEMIEFWLAQTAT